MIQREVSASTSVSTPTASAAVPSQRRVCTREARLAGRFEVEEG